MFSGRMTSKQIHVILLFMLVSLHETESHMQNLYRPLFEAQRGPLQTPKPQMVSEGCAANFERIIKNEPSEMIKVVDSFGKPQAGFLVGNWAWYGHFQECINITDFKYCLLYLEFNVSSFHIPQLPVIPIQWGLCAPQNCTEHDLSNHVDVLFDEFVMDSLEAYHVGNSSVHKVVAKCVQKPVKPYDAGFIFTMILCVILGLLMLGGTALHMVDIWRSSRDTALSVQADEDTAALMNEHNQDGHSSIQSFEYETGCRRVLKTIRVGFVHLLRDFSLSRNLASCLNTDVKGGQITCINGIRVLSMFWVILGHTYFFPQAYGGLQNLPSGLSWLSRIPFQIIVNAVYSVDTFFVLSGFLTCYLSLLKMSKKQGKMPWGFFYFHRYYRLTPVMLGAILVWMYMVPYMLWGPRASVMAERPYCPEYWWANIFYIQNFYPAHFGQSCIAWTWYLANDMQFFLITPIILVALYRIPWLGLSTVIALLVGSFATTGALTYHYDLGASGFSTSGADINGPDYGNILYQKPYCRIPPYLVGMLLGYLMYRLRDRPQFKVSPIAAVVGWMTAWVVALLVVFGLYGDFNGSPLSTLDNVLYQMFSRFAWGLCVAWVIFACHYGYGGWVNTFLSWKFWLPFSKLTYTAYLLHPMVISVFVANTAQPYYLSNVLQVFYFFAFIVVSYGSALLLSVSLEIPAANMENHLMSKIM